MPDHDFLFALEMSDDAESKRMLAELCTVVLGHLGYSAADTAAVAASLSAGLAAPAAGARRCDVRFVARGGQLQIAVSCAGSPEWRTTRPLPAS